VKRCLVPILLLCWILSTPILGAQSTTSSGTLPAGSSTGSGPVVCLPEADLAQIIQEEISRAVDLAVRAAVAEERGARAEAEVALANAQIDLDTARRRSRLGWYVAGGLGVVLVSWFTFTLVDVLTPEMALP